ncbi:semaphorin-2A [Trichonephila inaurata madagascariensis]|uniref:Semaphorin-2A n=1 Tax=Trichonephila inaurata madagascariensis TaxID=2747483 RepID=A0A8X6YH40_9ARAC|nr:semaphorin-2A [Trichonephila inaurata madagascariensis]
MTTPQDAFLCEASFPGVLPLRFTVGSIYCNDKWLHYDAVMNRCKGVIGENLGKLQMKRKWFSRIFVGLTGDAITIEPSNVPNCVSKGKSEHYDCRNHIRVIQPIGDGNRLYICGTNAHNPMDYVIHEAKSAHQPNPFRIKQDRT